MSIARKSKGSARQLAPKSPVVTSINSNISRNRNRNESILPFHRDRPASWKETQQSPTPITNVTGRNRRRQQKRTHKLNDQTIKILPQSEALPTWLQIVLRFQRRLSIGTFLLVGAVLVLYGSTVYSQKLWSQKYHQLQMLRRQERQLTAASEVFKNQLANQAQQPDNGLVSPTPQNNVFLEPSPVQTPAKDLPSTPGPTPSPKLTSSPIGY